ncbi:MAG: hypothetical protein ACREVE_07965 [Gammaproteobacteria bacterium]
MRTLPPVGLDIARLPEEIGLSIMAELIAHFRWSNFPAQTGRSMQNAASAGSTRRDFQNAM